MKITVIVPTYKRPKDLKRCLDGLKLQDRSVDELIVTVRDIDDLTWSFLETYNCDLLPLKIIKIEVTGVVAAMNSGLDVATGDIIAFTDDDAVPRKDWLEKIESHFLADNAVGAVGGRDVMYDGSELITGEKRIVGKIQWFGRAIGNHHLGIGNVREVDVLKGVNMSFRSTAIANMKFDERLLGNGAQVHFEILFCTLLKRNKWKLIYDPEIVVDHFRAERFDEDRRNNFNQIAWSNQVHNETVAIMEFLPPSRRIIYIIWFILIGTRQARGIVQLLRFLPTEGLLTIYKWIASMHGRYKGVLTLLVKTQNSRIA